MAVVCINIYLLIADFAFLSISGTCYTNIANTNDTHLQIVLRMLMVSKQIYQTCNGMTVLMGLSMTIERIL